jgi:hypothetical protein
MIWKNLAYFKVSAFKVTDRGFNQRRESKALSRTSFSEKEFVAE